MIGTFYYVYNVLGFGFLESIYAAAMERKLLERGHSVSREHAVRVLFEGEAIGFQRVDMIVNDKLVVEIKSSAILAPAADRQLLSYLRGTSLAVGLLLHFGPKPAFHRAVSTNQLPYRRDPPNPRDPRNP